MVKDIAVLDPTFNSGDNYSHVLRQLVERRFSGKLSLQCRTEMVNPEFLDLVEELNRFGKVILEFGLQTIHKEEMKIIERPNNLTKIKIILPEVIRRGIDTEISLIFGLPKQTVQSFQETIDFCKSYGVSKICAFPLMLLRGTKLYDRKNELDLVESTDINFLKIPRIQEGIPHVVASPSFTIDEWLKMGEMAEALEEENHSK
jgi:radical SAM superfamily enzyme